MTDEPRVQQLVDELLDSERTPEEVCADCPELLSEVRKRSQQMLRVVEAELDAMFPTPEPNQVIDTKAPCNPAVGLLHIPGYQVEAVLGRGGMGIVYKARHVRLNRPVALKMLLAGAYASAGERERFLREAEAVAGLRHVNLVQVYDVGDHDGRPYFTMEYVEGGSLAQKLLGAPQPVREATVLVAALADAVQAAHQGGIVHRDLKPSNILLQRKSGIPHPSILVPDPKSEGASPLRSDSEFRISDYDPKIADFGLARHFDAGPSLTLSGARVGTPSYMAPEQALGKTRAIGPAVDIYALGAVLYELLTGRPPFRGETSAETELQVIYQDPVSPTRLNARVPRDLETICLKCLHKEPERRYSSAAALADDLRRFLEGRPIQARRVGWAERFRRWCRRKPAAAALAMTALALVGLALTGVRSMELRQAERRAEAARLEQAVNAAFEKAAILEQEDRWPEARAVLEGAQRHLAGSAAIDLVERVNRALADADMVAKLEEIRLLLSGGPRSQELGPRAPERLYADAFRDYGIPVLTLEPAEAAARIRNSTIRETLLAFFHDWLYRLPDEKQGRLRDVLDRSDDDDWRHLFREALVAKDVKKLTALTHAPGALAQPPGVVTGLAAAMLGTMYKYEAQEFLRQAQQRYPDDFWINYLLGCFWWEEFPQEAVSYFRAAVAIRPTSDGACLMLGKALRGAGDTEGATAAFRRAVALRPTYSGYGIGSDVAAKELALALAPSGEWEEARAAWDKFLKRNPPEHGAWFGYAELCLFLGRESDYRRARRDLLERFGATRNPFEAERTARACLLRAATAEELRQAVSLLEHAIVERADEQWARPYFQFVHGLAEYRQGQFDRAIETLRGDAGTALGPAAPLVIAMALHQNGEADEARKTLASAVLSYNWSVNQARDIQWWILHSLRREAESMILPDLPAFLDGKYQPRDNDERLILLGICQFTNRTGAMARLYTDAFAAAPRLADDLKAGHRYYAARVAALAGCGQGADATVLQAEERTRWRKQARAWLRADLAMWAAKLEGDSPSERSLAKKKLTHWQADPDLAGLREPEALDEFPADEQTDCLALWQEVRALLKRSGQSRATAALNANRTEPRAPSPSILLRLGRWKEAQLAWRSALKADPLDHGVWYGYAELCLFLGEEDEYRSARRDLLEQFGETADPFVAERVSRACLLLPASGDELRQAVAVAERAVDRSPGGQGTRPYFQFARGLAEYRQGQFDGAIALMREDAGQVLGPAPALVIAMALQQKGLADDARKTFASAILSHDWRANEVRDIHACIYHSLRREAEGMILPNLPAFMDGRYDPQCNDERLALLGACQFMNRTYTMASLYADAFEADPALAEDLIANHRYNAARAAALAGCGHGEDAAGLVAEGRARLRREARQWLRADLAARARSFDAGSTATRGSVRLALTRWRSEPDLAGLRDPGELNRLDADEQKECLALWAEVAAVLARTQK